MYCKAEATFCTLPADTAPSTLVCPYLEIYWKSQMHPTLYKLHGKVMPFGCLLTEKSEVLTHSFSRETFFKSPSLGGVHTA